MRRMLDPTKVGGIPSTIEFDKDGNRKVGKNLEVDGVIHVSHLKRTPENTNGELRLGRYNIWTNKPGSSWINIFVYAPNGEHTGQTNTIGSDIADSFLQLKTGQQAHLMAGGYVDIDGQKYPVSWVSFNQSGSADIYYFDYVNKEQKFVQLPYNTKWSYSSVGKQLL